MDPNISISVRIYATYNYHNYFIVFTTVHVLITHLIGPNLLVPDVALELWCGGYSLNPKRQKEFV
jgi:hypothetical protein